MAALGDVKKEAATPPRLIIEKLVLENFKSYGGIREIGPFHHQFSSVVGPNGSGKSNTIDAMLFVFGKRGKRIRAPKVADLIHSSKNCQPETCKVTVHFAEVIDNDDDTYEKVKNSEFTVARLATKQNTSRYYFRDVGEKKEHGSDVTTVTEKLKEKDIDLDHNRFLILQGEVESISMMKPKAQNENEEGLLEYLEDLIGSNTFEEPIEKATKVLDEISEVRASAMTRLRAAEKDKEALEGPRKEAEEYVKAEASLFENRARSAQLQRYQGVKTCESAKKAMEEAQKALEEVRFQLKDEEKEVKQMDKQLGEMGKEVKKVKKQLELERLDFQKFEEKDTQLTEDRKHQENKMKQLEADIRTQKQKAENFKQAEQDLRNQIPNGQFALEAAEKELQAAEQNLENIMKEVRVEQEEKGKEKEAEEIKLQKLQGAKNEAYHKCTVAVGEAKAVNTEYTAAKQKREDLENEVKTTEERYKTREKELKEFQKKTKETLKETEKNTADITSMHKEKQELYDRLKAARGQFEEAKTSLRNMGERSQLLKQIMNAVRTGRLEGVHGRLGDLGTIDAKYDIAVTTACGSLDDLVCDNTENAQAALTFLRENNLGRARFIILDKVQGRKSTEEAPENLPRLVDLVKPKSEAYRVAFQYALGDTLVANNLEQATRVGLGGPKRRRVVTLDGKLVDTSGTMSGGGNAPAKGGMKSGGSSDVTEGEVNELGQKCEQLDKERKQLEEALFACEQLAGDLDKKQRDYDLATRQCDSEVKNLAEKKKLLANRLAAIPEVSMTKDQKEKQKAADKKAEQAEKEYQAICDDAKKYEDEIARLHDEIMNIGGQKLKDKKEAATTAKAKVEKLSKEVAKKQIEADKAKNDAVKAEEAIVKADDALDATNKTILVMEQERQQIDQQAADVLEKFQATRGVLDEKEAAYKELDEKRNTMADGMKEAKKKEIDALSELENKKKELNDADAQVTTHSKSLTKMRKEYELLPINMLTEGFDIAEEDGLSAIKNELDEEILAAFDANSIQTKILQLEGNVSQFKPNLSVIEDYKSKQAQFDEKKAAFDEVNQQRDDKRKELDQLRAERQTKFMTGFEIISMKLKEMYQMITMGGDAELELVDTLDPFSEGIHFSVRPPKKSWKQIQNLSGGEKTLSSLALVFALHHYKPTPLYFMDEIDAALDFRNVSIIANYIKERTKNAQFIVISLRNHMFELADRLVGIYKTHDISKSVAISTSSFGAPEEKEQAEQKAGAAIKAC
jgi:structural maintenance of chromosome 4